MVVPINASEDYGCVIDDDSFGVDFLECGLGRGDSDGEREVMGVGIGRQPVGECGVVVADVPGVAEEDSDVNATLRS